MASYATSLRSGRYNIYQYYTISPLESPISFWPVTFTIPKNTWILKKFRKILQGTATKLANYAMILHGTNHNIYYSATKNRV